MMKTFFLFILFSLSSLACDDGFVKINSRQIPVDSLDANAMTEKDFQEAGKQFEKFFGPELDRDHNAELQVFTSWSSNTVNAFAERNEDAWIITVYGGLARHKAITMDGLKLIFCHELGHHLGGYPKKSSNKWSSAEGQSDYFATTKCLRKWWEKENNQQVISNVVVPEFVKLKCAETYSDKNEQSLCQRMSMAGKSVALFIQDLDSDSIEPKFETPDTLVVRAINYMHPFSQCRLDTFFNGSLCKVSKDLGFDDQDETQGACHRRNGDLTGLRPQCWFLPRK